tara:strand:+ start:552 stop:665 length:114 start_codon:yes stop_codon:yes gene_type:complete
MLNFALNNTNIIQNRTASLKIFNSIGEPGDKFQALVA